MNRITEILQSYHNRKDFNCGKDILDNYLKHQANQDIKRKLSACFILVDQESDLIKGYYTLSSSNISLDLVPEHIRRRMPTSYLFLPATLLRRLAVDKRFQRQGIGRDLLVDALLRSYEISYLIGSYAVIVDPIDEAAESFYAKYGFIKLPGSGKMFLPMNTIKQLFEK